jgi:WD40 repeat protein/tRNA A-37 threonylcarbamoyl transferase component Bud32
LGLGVVMDLIGRNLGQYRIIEPIGAGGMATVYKAYQAGLDREVAVKVLPAQHALTPGFKERFIREAKAVAQLSHPNILPIYDVGVEDDISYFVMKYVPGQTLRDTMDQPMVLTRAAHFIDQIAGALDHAHARGILHRDIKPVNMLMEGDWLLLADFGLAKIVEASEALTTSGSSMGTPAYVSPEQATGKPVDQHTDIYSLGIVLYEMVTGRVPYTGETPMGVMFKHVYEPLPLPRKLQPDLPEAVERVILKAVAKNPQDRYDRAGELAEALHRAIDLDAGPVAVQAPAPQPAADDLDQTVAQPAAKTAPAEAGPTQPGTTAASAPALEARRPPWLWIGAGLLAVLVISGAIFFFAGGESDPTGLPTGRTEAGLADTAANEANTANGAGDNAAVTPAATEAPAGAATNVSAPEPAADAATNEPAPTLNSTEPAQNRPTITPPPAAGPTAIAGEAVVLPASARLGRGPINEIKISPDGTTLAVPSSPGVWLYDLDSLELIGLLDGQGSVIWAVAWSPDGSQLATASEEGAVRLVDAASGEELRLLSGPTDSALGAAISLAWSPDGSQVASGSEGGMVRVWDTASGQEVNTLTGHLYEAYGVAWSPDSTRLVSASRDATVRLWDVASGGELQVLDSHLDQVSSVAWTADGSRLATGSADLTIRIWDGDSGQEQLVMTGHTEPIASVAWSAGGDRLASGAFDNTIRIWDPASGEELGLLSGHTRPVVSLAWSPDGSRLVSGSVDGSIRVWNPATGEETGLIMGHSSDLRSVAWSPDGSRLAVAGFDGKVRRWDIAAETEETPLDGAGAGFLSVAWSPDGSQLAAGEDDGTIQIWDVTNEQVVHSLTGHTDQVNDLAWSPDGRLVASAGGDGTVRLWDSVSGAKLRELAGHTDSIYGVAWSPDGSQLISGSLDQTIGVWDAVSGEEINTLEGRTDGYKQTVKLRGGDWVASVAWSPDGKRLASGSGDFVIRLWDGGSGAELRMLEGHEGPVLSVAWSPDNTRLASVSPDRTVRIWDAVSGAELYLLLGHEDEVVRAAWSPDGNQVASVGDDGLIRIWDIPFSNR